MNDALDYDPLAAARGESNSALARAAILREKIRADKAAEEAKIREQKNSIIARNTGVLKEIALVLGVPHDIEETDHDSKLILRKVAGHVEYKGWASFFPADGFNTTIDVRNGITITEKKMEKFRDVIQAAQEGGYTKLWLKRYFRGGCDIAKEISIGVKYKYQTIYPQRGDYFFDRNYQRRLTAVLREIQEETIKMLAEEV